MALRMNVIFKLLATIADRIGIESMQGKMI